MRPVRRGPSRRTPLARPPEPHRKPRGSPRACSHPASSFAPAPPRRLELGRRGRPPAGGRGGPRPGRPRPVGGSGADVVHALEHDAEDEAEYQVPHARPRESRRPNGFLAENSLPEPSLTVGECFFRPQIVSAGFQAERGPMTPPSSGTLRTDASGCFAASPPPPELYPRGRGKTGDGGDARFGVNPGLGGCRRWGWCGQPATGATIPPSEPRTTFAAAARSASIAFWCLTAWCRPCGSSSVSALCRRIDGVVPFRWRF